MSGARPEVFLADVVATGHVGSAWRRIVLGGPGLAGFVSTGVGDEYIRVIFPDDPWGLPAMPGVVDGAFDFRGVPADKLRTYTVRSHDPGAGTVTVDIVVHEGGVAATWALAARPGQRVAITSPTGLYAPPPDATWQLLVADLAAAPAALRIAETTTLPTRLIIEVADAGQAIPVPRRPGLDVRWVVGGNGFAPSRVEQIVRAAGADADGGYRWIAGEAKALRGVRRYLRRELGLPASAYKAVGYWIEDAERWRSRYETLDAATRATLEGLWTHNLDLADVEIVYDAELSRLGL